MVACGYEICLLVFNSNHGISPQDFHKEFRSEVLLHQNVPYGFDTLPSLI